MQTNLPSSCTSVSSVYAALLWVLQRAFNAICVAGVLLLLLLHAAHCHAAGGLPAEYAGIGDQLYTFDVSGNRYTLAA
jgi:hypothetical protein